jgi:hypothetical protein
MPIIFDLLPGNVQFQIFSDIPLTPSLFSVSKKFSEIICSAGAMQMIYLNPDVQKPLSYRDPLSRRVYAFLKNFLPEEKDLYRLANTTFIECRKVIHQLLTEKGVAPEAQPKFLPYQFPALDELYDSLFEQGTDNFIKICNELEPDHQITASTIADLENKMKMLDQLSSTEFGEVFVLAAKLGHCNCIEPIRKCEKFSSISPVDLGRALRIAVNFAANFGHIEFVKMIVELKQRFSQIPLEIFEKALMESAAHPSSCFELLFQSSRNKEITNITIGRCLVNATSQGCFDNVCFIRSLPSYDEILPRHLESSYRNALHGKSYYSYDCACVIQDAVRKKVKNEVALYSRTPPENWVPPKKKLKT